MNYRQQGKFLSKLWNRFNATQAWLCSVETAPEENVWSLMRSRQKKFLVITFNPDKTISLYNGFNLGINETTLDKPYRDKEHLAQIIFEALHGYKMPHYFLK